MAQLVERLPHNRKVDGSSHGRVIPKTLKMVLAAFLFWRSKNEKRSGEVKHAELPVDQPPAVALTVLADAWPRAIETEIGAALCAIGRGKDFDFFFVECRNKNKPSGV